MSSCHHPHRYFQAVEPKKPLSPRIRGPIKDALDEVVEDLGGDYGMQAWCVEAALLMFFDAGLDAQREWVMKARNAAMHGGTAPIIREIKAKRAGGAHASGIVEDD